MPKVSDPSDTPATMSGQVIARLAEIEAWFRAGFKTKEVLEKLALEGINLHRVTFIQLLSRYGKTESAVRRAMAAEAGAVADPSFRRSRTKTVRAPLPLNKPPDYPPAKSSSAIEDLRRKEKQRVEFKPDKVARKEDLI